MRPMTRFQRLAVLLLGVSAATLVVMAGFPHTHDDGAASPLTHTCRLCRLHQDLHATSAKPILTGVIVWPQAGGTVLPLEGVRPSAFNLTSASPRAPPFAS